MYQDYFCLLDTHLAPPYPDYFKIQQAIWKCIWMRNGNRVIRGTVPKIAPPADLAFDVLD